MTELTSDPTNLSAGYDVYIVRHTGRLLLESEEAYARPLSIINRRLNREYSSDMSFLAQYEISDEADMFRTAVCDARDFLSTLGLGHTATSHLISAEGRRSIGVEWKASFSGASNQIHLFADTLQDLAREEGDESLAATLVHEGIHVTRAKRTLGLTRYPDEQPHWISRFGFKVLKKGVECGVFYEEGLAEYAAGLYRRRKADPKGSFISLSQTEYPSDRIPDHYSTNMQVAGPDGYAIELLAYGIERKGIAEADVFIQSLLSSRRQASAVESLRAVAHMINALRPGLYTELRSLQYSREEWRHGLSLAYEAATK